MRLRFAVLCVAASLLTLAATSSLAGAAPHHNRGLTINAIPNPVDAGDGVLIYGQLSARNDAGRTIVLYHHVADAHQGYVAVGRATTDARGFYEFTREENVVETNRSWFVRLADQPWIHSRTLHERVRALVSLSASATVADTRHAVTFTGTVQPDHAGQRVLLQQRRGDDWRTLKSARLDGSSGYSIQYRWRTPGERVLRVLFPGDRRNVAGESDPVSVVVEQTQNPGFTIATSTPVITYGGTAQISGMLSQAGRAGGSTAVSLCHRSVNTSAPVCDQTTTTGADGSYSFVVMPAQNAWYFAQKVSQPHRRSAQLFIGVKDIITLQVTSQQGTVGQPDTFSGTVTPNKAGDLVLLQYKGRDEDWHTVAVTRVSSDGAYALQREFTHAGTRTFRTRILSDSANLGATSNEVTVSIAPAPASTLAPAS